MGVSPSDIDEFQVMRSVVVGKASLSAPLLVKLVKIDSSKKDPGQGVDKARFVLLDVFTLIVNDRDPRYRPVT